MPGKRRGPPFPWLNPAILVGGLVPLASILLRARTGELGANPIAEALNELGLLALVLLIASLACTPLKVVSGWTWPVRVRRLVGLLAFTYALLHFSVYAFLDQGLDLSAIAGDVVKRKFIFVGFSALLLMIPLAATSTNAAVRKMGFVKWQRLHMLAYPAAVLGVIHFVWRVKADLTEPLTYGAILGVLLLVRVVVRLRKGATPRPQPMAPARG